MIIKTAQLLSAVRDSAESSGQSRETTFFVVVDNFYKQSFLGRLDSINYVVQ